MLPFFGPPYIVLGFAEFGELKIVTFTIFGGRGRKRGVAAVGVVSFSSCSGLRFLCKIIIKSEKNVISVTVRCRTHFRMYGKLLAVGKMCELHAFIRECIQVRSSELQYGLR